MKVRIALHLRDKRETAHILKEAVELIEADEPNENQYIANAIGRILEQIVADVEILDA